MCKAVSKEPGSRDRIPRGVLCGNGAPAPTPSLDPVFALPLGVGAVTSGQVAVRMEETQTDVSAKPRGPVAVTWSLGCVSPPLTFPKGWSGQVKRTEMVRE